MKISAEEAALVARLVREGKGVAAAKVTALATELAKEYEPRSIPADRSCLRCGNYTTTEYCSGACFRGERGTR